MLPFSREKSKYSLLLGQRLRVSRKSIRWTQKQIAQGLGLTAKTVINYELGDRTPDGGVLQKWVDITGCDAGWLLTGQGSMEGGEASGRPLSEQDQYFQNLSERLRNVLLKSDEATVKEILGSLGEAELNLETRQMEKFDRNVSKETVQKKKSSLHNRISFHQTEIEPI